MVEQISQQYKMKLDEANLRKFAPVRTFMDFKQEVFSMDFHRDGKMLVVSWTDDSMTLYNCEEGTNMRTVNSKKYGVGEIRFDHDSNAVLHSSTKIDNTIRYLSLNENKYVRYFLGHSARVSSINVSPRSHHFVSSGQDETTRLWDMRLNSCLGVIKSSEDTLSSFDPEGLIIATASATEQAVSLYDMRSFDKGPFEKLEVANPKPEAKWCSFRFGTDGINALISTDSNFSLVFGTLDNGPIQQYVIDQAPANTPIGASFTPCGQYLVVGSTENKIYFFDIPRETESAPQTELQPISPRFYVQSDIHQNKALSNVLFNPQFAHIAVGSHVIEFWVPEIAESE